MKKVIVFVAVSIFAASLPALAGEAQTSHDEKCLKECRMQVRNCRQEADSIQQRITKLNREIEKGTAVYTAEELRNLRQKLQETEETLANMTFGS